MNFLTPTETVDSPCKDVLSYPFQCFREQFLATPAFLGTFLVSIGGFAAAVILWGAIFGAAIYLIFFVFKHLFRAARYFFTNTKVGQQITKYVPIGNYIQRFFCRARQEIQPKKLINTQAIGDYGANIVSKVHVDSKWFKSALKHVPFTKSSDDQANVRSPSKTPQRSTSRISALTPKILSPKSNKQQ